MTQPNTRHVERVVRFVAKYGEVPVSFSHDDVYEDGIIVRARGTAHFGTVWTSDGLEEIAVTEVQRGELNDIRAVLEDGRQVTPEEYRQLVAV